MSYEQGWNDAFDAIAAYLNAEVCPVTAEMVKRMKGETWRYPDRKPLEDAEKAQGEQEVEIAREQGEEK